MCWPGRDALCNLVKSARHRPRWRRLSRRQRSPRVFMPFRHCWPRLKRTKPKPSDLADLLSWMSQAGLNLLAIDFLRAVPGEMVEQWPVTVAVADVYVKLKDWDKLERATKSANWRDRDFLRHAYLSRAFKEQSRQAAADHEWELATRGASESSEQTLMLMRTVSGWGWENESTQLMWALSKY